MSLADVVAVLRLDANQFQAKLGEVETQMGKLSKSGGSNFEKLAQGGKLAFLAVGAAAVGVGVASVDLAMKYQATTTSIAAGANISVASAKKITDAFLGTAGTTMFSAQQIATS